MHILWSAEEQKSTEILYLSLEVEDPLFWQLPAEVKKKARERARISSSIRWILHPAKDLPLSLHVHLFFASSSNEAGIKCILMHTFI